MSSLHIQRGHVITVASPGAYIGWISKWPSSNIFPEDFVNTTTLSNDANIWPSSILYEKHNLSKSSNINTILKCLGLDLWLQSNFSNTTEIKVTIKTKSKQLKKIFDGWLLFHKLIGHDNENLKKHSHLQLDFKRDSTFLLSIIDSLLWLAKYVFLRAPLTLVDKTGWVEASGQTILLNYITGTNLTDQSRTNLFWDELPSLLSTESGSKLRVLNIYMPLKGIWSSFKLLAKLRHEKNCRFTEVDLSSFLSIQVLYNSLVDYCKILLSRRIRPSFILNGFDFTSLLIKDWNNSFSGRHCMSSILYSHLFDKCFSTCPPIYSYYYLCEGFGWESLSLQLYHKYHPGISIAFPHSTTKYWDLRLYDDSLRLSLLCNSNQNPRVTPDKIASSSPLSDSIWHDYGIHNTRMITVESLRYIRKNSSTLSTTHSNLSLNNDRNSYKKVLLLGDYYEHFTITTIKALTQAQKLAGDSLYIVFKPHPSASNHLIKYLLKQTNHATITNEKISRISRKTDLTVVPINSSAVIDCLLFNLQLILYHDEQYLNTSPIRGTSFANCVRNPQELCNVIQSHQDVCIDTPLDSTEVIRSDPTLPHWKQAITDINKSLNL